MPRLTEYEKSLLRDPRTPRATKRALRAKERGFRVPKPKSRVTTEQQREHRFGRVSCRDCAYVEPPSYRKAKSSTCKETGRTVALDEERRCNKYWPRGKLRPRQAKL